MRRASGYRRPTGATRGDQGVTRGGVTLRSPLMFSRLIEDWVPPVDDQPYCSLPVLARQLSRSSCRPVCKPGYTKPLPALRAAGAHQRFVEGGGRLLVFGAGCAREDAYDWLPFPVTYSFAYGPRAVHYTCENECTTLFNGYDLAAIECDGTFPEHDGETLALSVSGDALLVKKTVGDGMVLVTSIHEYPSAEFLKRFTCSDKETLF